jgi:hypothetical protein
MSIQTKVLERHFEIGTQLLVFFTQITRDGYFDRLLLASTTGAPSTYVMKLNKAATARRECRHFYYT